MTAQSKFSRVTKILLITLLIFLSLSGLFGILFLIDPSGEMVGMPVDLLDKLPIDTFFLPGLYLFMVYGIGSATIAYGLIRQRAWAPAAGILLGLVLIGWVIGQIILWGTPVMLQYIYFIVGAAIFLLSFTLYSQESDAFFTNLYKKGEEEFQARKYKEAIKVLEIAIFGLYYDKEIIGKAHIYKSLCHYYLGDKTKSIKYLNDAFKYLDETKFADLELKVVKKDILRIIIMLKKTYACFFF